MKTEEKYHIDIDKIENPSFLKDLTYSQLDDLSEELKEYILDITSKNGGHLSSNLGVIDSTIALCRVFDFSKDKIVFDVGHQSYTYKILTGRNLSTLRKKDGISGFQKRHESHFDHFEAGHSSTSISAVNGLAIARDLKKEKYDVIAFIGDASIANGLAFEAINNAAQGKHKIIIVLNNNGMSISKSTGGTANFFRSFSTTSFYTRSKSAIRRVLSRNFIGNKLLGVLIKFKNFVKRTLVSLNAFDYFGYKIIGPIDGHDIKKVEKALMKAKKLDKSVIVFLRTKKGRGYTWAENDVIGEWHGVGKFDIETGHSLTLENNSTWSDVYKILLEKNMADNDKLFAIVPGTGYGSSLVSIAQKFPKRFLDVGIAEEHAVTLSAALAVEGLHPVISMYSTFLQRSYDQISHDLARLKSNATLLIDRSGLVGPDGETHQGIYDEQFLYGIPNTTIAMASRYSEAEMLFQESIQNHGVFAIRYPREPAIEDKKSAKYIPYGHWKEELKGEKTAIVSVGPITVSLAKKLTQLKKNVTLYNAIYQKPMDEECVKELLKYNKVIIYNAYAIKEGFANELACKLMLLGYKGTVIIKALPDLFIPQATIKEQQEKYQVTVNDIIAEI